MKSFTARDVMNPEVLSVRDDMTLHELATFLTGHAISGAPVLDRNGKLVGVVSLTDIALSEAERAAIEIGQPVPGYYSGGWKDRLNREDLAGLHLEEQGLLVRDIMTPAVYTIPESLPLRQIAETMIAGRLHRLLVTRNHHLIGIVTPFDILNLLVRQEVLE
jgi:CBS domain-containing protein